MFWTIPATGEREIGRLSKKWAFLYVLGSLITTSICVSGSIAWWFEGKFHEYLGVCGMGIGIAAILQSTSLMITSKRISHEREDISSGEFAWTLMRLLGSRVSVGASMHLVGVSLLLSGMMIWKTYSQFFGVWIAVTSVGYMVVMPLLHWTDPRYIPSTKHTGYR